MYTVVVLGYYGKCVRLIRLLLWKCANMIGGKMKKIKKGMIRETGDVPLWECGQNGHDNKIS